MPTWAGMTHVKVEEEDVDEKKVEILDSLISMNLTQCIDSSSMKEEEDFNFQFLEQSGTKLECDNSLEGFHFGNGGGVGGFNEDTREQLDADMDAACTTVLDLPATSSSMCLDFESLDSVDGQETNGPDESIEIGEEEALLLAAAATAADESSDRESIGPVEQTSSSQCRNKGSKGAASSGRRKTKVDWTQELHRRFVQAVEQLGVEKAIPSRILELMGVQCLTRHNIASHLQKYRSHRRHMIARDVEAASWRHRRPLTWARSQQEGNAWLAPIQTSSSFPAAHPYASAGLPTIQPRLPAHGHHIGAHLVVWGHPTVDHSPSHMWQQPPVNTLPFSQEPDSSTYWQQTAPASIDSWTHPSIFPAFPYPFFGAPYAPSFCASQLVAPGITSNERSLVDESLPVALYQTTAIDSDISAAAGAAACSKPSDFLPPQEILDAVISEALANPCTPLPLGLKPPSVAAVMAELFRQGINIVATSTS